MVSEARGSGTRASVRECPLPFRRAARSSWLQFLARTRGMAVRIGFERKKITAVTRLIRRIAAEPWRIYWLAVSVVTDRALQVAARAARRDVVFFRLIDIPRCQASLKDEPTESPRGERDAGRALLRSIRAPQRVRSTTNINNALIRSHRRYSRYPSRRFPSADTLLLSFSRFISVTGRDRFYYGTSSCAAVPMEIA